MTTLLTVLAEARLHSDIYFRRPRHPSSATAAQYRYIGARVLAGRISMDAPSLALGTRRWYQTAVSHVLFPRLREVIEVAEAAMEVGDETAAQLAGDELERLLVFVKRLKNLGVAA